MRGPAPRFASSLLTASSAAIPASSSNCRADPVRFALGAEYRREKGDYIDDPFINAGDPLSPTDPTINPTTQTNTNAVVIGRFDPDAFKVKEAFGELQIPILKDVPFFDELTLSGAARVAKYNKVAGDVGTVWTYNAGLDWAPVRDIRFRGNYGRAVRAPNLSETVFPPVPNFAPGFTDPCASNVIANNPNRAANCIAALAPAQLASIRTAAISLPVISGSNPNLGEETSDLLDGRRGHPAALHPGSVGQRRLVQDQGRGRHRLADRSDDRQQLLRPAEPEQRVLHPVRAQPHRSRRRVWRSSRVRSWATR